MVCASVRGQTPWPWALRRFPLPFDHLGVEYPIFSQSVVTTMLGWAGMRSLRNYYRSPFGKDSAPSTTQRQKDELSWNRAGDLKGSTISALHLQQQVSILSVLPEGVRCCVYLILFAHSESEYRFHFRAFITMRVLSVELRRQPMDCHTHHCLVDLTVANCHYRRHSSTPRRLPVKTITRPSEQLSLTPHLHPDPGP
ncbi:hypothetical protein BDY21DRAFT_348069 [Lineolata rhizophorae]|uniref:Uncharacterized protein n=1 Tax=Lineolata rhizophorae TaxID=578093 RepID=A0A6A6NWP3_9PEZI|nr:hypothetical protein BDY21DRAFT_348069 [Lineolata rhizophorae]